MTLEAVIQWIGLSHLLQPPLAHWFVRQAGLRDAFSRLPPLPAQIAYNMRVASIALPTCLGLLIATSAREVVAGGGARHLAYLVAAFWTWRLVRQFRIGRHASSLPHASVWHWGLTLIFGVQGPLLAAALLWAM